MAPVWFALRAGTRRRWRALVSLALLLGLAGGVVLTAAAGARRTDTAYPRLLAWASASQVTVQLGGLDPAYFAALNQLPQVAAVATAMQYNLALPVRRAPAAAGSTTPPASPSSSARLTSARHLRRVPARSANQTGAIGSIPPVMPPRINGGGIPPRVVLPALLAS